MNSTGGYLPEGAYQRVRLLPEVHHLPEGASSTGGYLTLRVLDFEVT